MSHHHIFLKPVYSAPASELPNGVNLPESWSALAWHQVETLKALNNPEIDVVFNVAMTGDGKSLAAYLKTLTQKLFSVVSLYPTNELARDQEAQVKNYIDLFQPNIKPRCNRLSGELLELYAEEEGQRKKQTLDHKARHSQILISNPDLFHYIYRGAYLSPLENKDSLWGKIQNYFELMIFDEFHVFSAPQISSVLNTMLLRKFTQGKNIKFLFLSATPDRDFIKRLTKAAFSCQVIDPEAQDKYQFPLNMTEQAKLTQQNWRKVVSQIELEFIPLESSSQASEAWLKQNAQLIVAQFNSVGSKGAIILNSVAAVKRLVPFFRDLLKPLGLTVSENTGLASRETKENSLAADLVIGTSTIDVGVDFKINFLLFESADAGNFIQRLGRLGRHQGYEKAGETIHFESFKGFALVPNFFVERLFEKEDASLVAGEFYDRPFFHKVVRDEYRNINDFSGYYKRWGGFQSLKLSRDLNQKEIRKIYEESKKAFMQSCEQALDFKFCQVGYQWKEFEQQWFDLSGKKGNPITEEACSFRGSSDLQCGLYDLTENQEQFRFKTYGLPGILSNLDIEPIAKAEFERLLDGAEQKTGEKIAKGRFRHCFGFMKLRGYHKERLNWKFIYNGDLLNLINRWQVQVLAGLKIWQPENRWIGKINKEVAKKHMVVYLLKSPVSEVRARLQLPMHFQIYPICDQKSLNDSKVPYSITFGQSALLVDTLAYRFEQKGGNALIF